MLDPQHGEEGTGPPKEEYIGIGNRDGGHEQVQPPTSDLDTPLASEQSALYDTGEPFHKLPEERSSSTLDMADHPLPSRDVGDTGADATTTATKVSHVYSGPPQDYFALPKSSSHPRLSPARALLDQTTHPPLQASSSSSLQSEADKTVSRGHTRTLSLRSSGSGRLKRSPSRSRLEILTKSTSRQSPSKDHPVYPEQSLASLQTQFHVVRPSPPLRTRSSHPAGSQSYSDMASSRASIDRSPGKTGSRTVDNTPISSPGLFKMGTGGTTLSPGERGQLHHLQAPKETHTAEIDHDLYSGNKYINKYEVIEEIGRGEHGKVKLGRNLETSSQVAIKIVPRYSVRRRLGRLGAPEDRTKREVAILKKAKHENVVALLEVIDDPSKNKVYLILEFVEKGEIKWRKQGVPEVLAVNNARFEKEKHGANVTTEVFERDMFSVNQAFRRHELLDRARAAQSGNIPNWSLEHGFDEDEEDSMSELSRSQSRSHFEHSVPSRTSSRDDYRQLAELSLAGTMYGSYIPDAFRHRKFSVAMSAASHMSSDINFGENDDEHGYVPALTLEEARRAFRDVLTGLAFLKEIGIIHRDIKPANLLMASDGMVKISDFGVSYLGRPTSEEDPDNRVTEAEAFRLDDEKELARSVGTPAFWAPEMCYEDPTMFTDQPPRITGALDLWALGITLYCMIYARLPFYATDEMGLHEAVCTAEVFTPKTRLVPVDTARDQVSASIHLSAAPGKRLDYELKFEPVPEAVRDLIRRLLVKDPAHRMTISEARQHPWVVEGLSNVEEWIKSPTMEKEIKNKILQVDDKELSHAVVKRNIIERTVTAAKNFAGSLLGRSGTRKRSSSNATPSGHSSDSLYSPQGSNASTVGKNDKANHHRKTSILGDDLLNALKASREPSHEHPLAQSLTASPVDSDHESSLDNHEFDSKVTSTDAPPIGEHDNRPKGPDRAESTISTADSVKTIRASQIQRSQLSAMSHDLEASALPESRSKMAGLWEGTSRHFGRLRSLDRSSRTSHDRSRGSSRHSTESDAHAGPSLAVSTASAAGAIATPDVLRSTSSPDEYSTETTSPKAISDSRHPSHFVAPASSDEAFEHAQDINQRRLILESQYSVQAAATATARRQSRTSSQGCPPSPDDIMYLQQRVGTENASSPVSASVGESKRGIASAPSESTIASSVGDFAGSSVSQSMSNPSFGMVSGASSPPGEVASSEYKDLAHGVSSAVGPGAEPAFMRTADTITQEVRGSHEALSGQALEVWSHKGYEDQGDYDPGFDDDDCSDDDEDDGMIMMGGSTRRV